MDYVVERRLGRGGMGVVDLAVAPDGSRVALKRVALHGSDDAVGRARARIRREAEVLGRLRHPRIVGLLDVVDDGDEIVLVMPWLAGGSLADRVAEHGPMPPEQVANIADHLLGAIASAHRAGVVHRDVKPANVLFDDRSRPHLADFGVATARDVTAGLTGTGLTVGSPGFLAPEQARAEPVGPAADVFSLGATLRWALTGQGPYGAVPSGAGQRDVLLWRAAQGRIEPCPDTVPADLRRRVDAMLAADPGDRPTAAALAGGPDGTAERPVARPSGRPTGRPSGRPSGRATPGPGRTPWAAVAAVVVGAMALTGAVLALVGDDDPAGGGVEAGDDGDAGGATTSTAPCIPRPYQPCGGQPAPGTDGALCIDERADYDGDATNGCEALPDALDDTALGEVEATIVPTDDIDRFTVEVDDRFQLGCDGRITFDLTAPPGMAVRLTVLDEGGEVLGELTSADGVPAQLRVREPDCGGDDSGTLTAVVNPVGSDRTGEPYQLVRSGNW